MTKEEILMNFDKLEKEEAKLYAIYGRHYYYRTPSGETFSIIDGYKKEYFYCGNAYMDSNEKKIVHIKHDDIPKLLKKITFDHHKEAERRNENDERTNQ